MRKLSNYILVLFSFFCSVQAQNISTIAGGGPYRLPSLQTGLPFIPSLSGLAVDSSGNVFASFYRSIWKFDNTGTVSLYAGSGLTDSLGDGGPALYASFCSPTGLAFDPAGNLYVADSCAGRVRKISTAGIISTVAGTTYRASGPNGDQGPAIAAALASPVSIALDAQNNLYIADRSDSRVRLVSAATGIITTFAGSGSPLFSGDGGPASSASLNYPTGVAVDSLGTVYISDSGNNRVRKVAGGIITTVAGTGNSGFNGNGASATSADLYGLTGVAVNRFNDLFILESSDIRVIRAGQSDINSYAGGLSAGYSGDGASFISASFSGLSAMAFDSSLNVYLADTGNHRIRKLASTTVSTYAGNGSSYDQPENQTAANLYFQSMRGIALSPAGEVVFPDASRNFRSVNLNTGLFQTYAGNGIAGFTADDNLSGDDSGPSNSVIDAYGALYFVDGNRIRKLFRGNVVTLVTLNISYGSGYFIRVGTPYGLAVAQNGDVYFAVPLGNIVQVLKAGTGAITTVAGNGTILHGGDGGLATNAALNYPSSLALDGTGNLYIGEGIGSFVRKVNLNTGVITTIAGDGGTGFSGDGVIATSTSLYNPYGLFADQSGNVFIADRGNYRVRLVSAATKLISTVAGNGINLFSGDGGLATTAGVQPVFLTVDRSEKLYIADDSGRIRVTPVTACFFSLSSPTFAVTKAGGTGSFTLTATHASCPYSVSASSPFVAITSGGSGTGNGTITFNVASNSGASRTATVSLAGQSFTVSQGGIAAPANVGFFQPGNPSWALDANSDGLYNAGDKFYLFGGQPGAIAMVGDWNGDGRSKIGYYLNGFWQLDYNGDGIFTAADKFYGYGSDDPSYIPVVGDWNGDGKTKIGYYHRGFWALDFNGDGTPNAGDIFTGFGSGAPGEIPIVGDWNGNKKTKIGIYYNGAWTLDYNGDGAPNSGDRFYSTFSYYVASDKPVVGDWNGDGTTKIGVYRAGFWILDYNGNGTYEGGVDKFYGFGGTPGEIPLVADWNGDGRTKIGFYINGFWQLDYNGNGSFDGIGVGGDRFIGYYGGAGSQPIIGRW